MTITKSCQQPRPPVVFWDSCHGELPGVMGIIHEVCFIFILDNDMISQ
ncbi:hypothetical protein [Desulfosporosinus sp.]|nr:hypothetical protein [Desulfosporosinus sp.]MBC2726729.1 hypothetical protein [Desulfosporosinus sp.]